MNDASWVTIEPAQTTGLAWRCTRVHWLTPQENRGRHNVFVNVYVQGVAIRGGLYAEWGWEGQQQGQLSPNVPLNKLPPDPCGDIPINKGQHIWLRIVGGDGYPSDTVRNLHSEIVGNNDGNSLYHQSYAVDFELLPNTSTPPQPPTLTEALVVLTQIAHDMSNSLLALRAVIAGLK